MTRLIVLTVFSPASVPVAMMLTLAGGASWISSQSNFMLSWEPFRVFYFLFINFLLIKHWWLRRSYLSAPSSGDLKEQNKAPASDQLWLEDYAPAAPYTGLGASHMVL